MLVGPWAAEDLEAQFHLECVKDLEAGSWELP